MDNLGCKFPVGKCWQVRIRRSSLYRKDRNYMASLSTLIAYAGQVASVGAELGSEI